MNGQQTYARFARYYDTYTHGFTDDLPVYCALCKGRARILEVGCGTGRVLEALLRDGHQLCGVDTSRPMLAAARRKLSPYLASRALTLRQHDYRRMQLGMKFDAALVTWYTANYLLDEKELLAFLSNIRCDLRSGAVLMMDLFRPMPLMHPEYAGQWHRKTYAERSALLSLRDKRTMAGDIEERVQVFTRGTHSTTIRTRRRFYSKQTIAQVVRQAGYGEIMFMDGYGKYRFHRLKKAEGTASGFLVRATIR